MYDEAFFAINLSFMRGSRQIQPTELYQVKGWTGPAPIAIATGYRKLEDDLPAQVLVCDVPHCAAAVVEFLIRELSPSLRDEDSCFDGHSAWVDAPSDLILRTDPAVEPAPPSEWPEFGYPVCPVCSTPLCESDPMVIIAPSRGGFRLHPGIYRYRDWQGPDPFLVFTRPRITFLPDGSVMWGESFTCTRPECSREAGAFVDDALGRGSP